MEHCCGTIVYLSESQADYCKGCGEVKKHDDECCCTKCCPPMDSYVKKRSSVSQSLKQHIRRNCKTMGLSLSMFQDAHIFFHLEWLRSMTDKSINHPYLMMCIMKQLYPEDEENIVKIRNFLPKNMATRRRSEELWKEYYERFRDKFEAV